MLYIIIQRVSEASEADYQSCSIEISDIYIYSASSLKSELSEIYDAITKTTVIYEVCMINI